MLGDGSDNIKTNPKMGLIIMIISSLVFWGIIIYLFL
jgi:hypothetical protein